ncbi:MAG: putative colanic acid biosynthesis acetyltransferase WcaF [Chthoniobacter sp.]|nr:putative colanic acid biosynthesis acetyltransferase WcaF [Chthoniobacter sp.]
MRPQMQLEGYTTGDFDRGATRWKEALWVAVKCLFFLTPLPWPSVLRVALLRAFGASIGDGVVVRAEVNVTFPWRLVVGDHVWLGEEVVVLSLAIVTIESNVCLSQRVFLCTGSHDFRAPGFDLQTKPITVRERSWVAAQAFVAPGIEIGPGSMVAAGSVVLEDVPPGVLVRGNPAVVVRKWEEVDSGRTATSTVRDC